MPDDPGMQPGGKQDQGLIGNNRRSGRVRVHMVRSELGDLRDLSATGARVLSKGGLAPRKGEMLRFNIEGVDGCINVCARVVWCRRRGWFSREFGLEFLDVDAPTRAALAALARTAPANQIYGVDPERRASA